LGNDSKLRAYDNFKVPPTSISSGSDPIDELNKSKSPLTLRPFGND
jgi:hypothetical protein